MCADSEDKTSLFPMPQMREGQQQFYFDAKDAAENGKILLANAPTGIGKTAAVLSAVLEAALPAERTVLFLTNRVSHHLQALEEIHKINELKKGELAKLRPYAPRILAVDKISKEKMCIYKLRDPPQIGLLRCEMSRSFCKYSRPDKDVVQGVLDGNMSAAGANAYCVAKSACPHFASLAAMKGADLVIADYRYIFDEGVRDVFLKSSGFSLKDTDVIIDEAHNLPEAVREIGSPTIDKNSCQLAMDGLKVAKRLATKMGDNESAESFSAPYNYIKHTLSDAIEQMGLSGEEGEDALLSKKAMELFNKSHYHRSTLGTSERSIAQELVNAAGYARDAVSKQMDAEEFDAEGVQGLTRLASFLSSASAVAQGDKKSGIFSKKLGEEEFEMRAVLFDPSFVSQDVFSMVHSAVLMSGTLVGKKSFIDLLGIEPQRVSKPEDFAYQSAFSPLRHPISICSSSSSRQRDRTDGESVKLTARIIADAAKACLPYSVAVFYPSYDYMALVGKQLDLPEFTHEREKRNTAGKTGEHKIRIEKEVQSGPVMLHAVIGGSYSEGIDFKGNPFKLIIVAGFAHPKWNAQHQAYESYLNWKFESKGKAELYSSIYPAIIHSVQALGRGIRSENDWCYGLLLDDRFEEYRKHLPANINGRARLLSSLAIIEDVKTFANSEGKT